MNFKLFSLIALGLNLVQGVTYMNCREAKDDVEKCNCYLRQETFFQSTNCDATKKVALDAVNKACENISYCRDAYAHNDDHCPKAIWNYSTSSCRNACLTEIQRSLTANPNVNIYYNCIVSTEKIVDYYCTNDLAQSSRTCRSGWRKEA